MRYYIKLLGWKDHPMPFRGTWFQTMVTQHMAHARLTSEVRTANTGDKFLLYCIMNRFTDIVGGGFVGINTVKGPWYRNPAYFGEPWTIIHDVSLDFLVPLERLLPLQEVRRWQDKSPILNKALKANLQFLPLREITKTDYDQFESALRRRI